MNKPPLPVSLSFPLTVDTSYGTPHIKNADGGLAFKILGCARFVVQLKACHAHSLKPLDFDEECQMVRYELEDARRSNGVGMPTVVSEQSLKQQLAERWGMPEFEVDPDADGSHYSSIIVHSTPIVSEAPHEQPQQL